MSKIIPIPLSSFKGAQPVQMPDGTPGLLAGPTYGFSADLGVTPRQLQAIPGNPNYFYEGTYTLSFAVVNHFPNYPGYYKVEIDFGTQELCSVDGWGKGTVTQVTIICPGPNYIVIDQSLPTVGPAQGYHNLVLNVSQSQWPLYFNNFSLTFTPVN